MSQKTSEPNVSYLNARDPSILTWNRPAIEARKLKFSEIPEEKEKMQDGNPNHINVFLRIRGDVPLSNDLYEVNENTLICKLPEGSHALRNAKDGESVTKKFHFSDILGPEIGQTKIFDGIIKEKILDFLNGVNATFLTYGASGSGKTYTVVGTAREPGLIPRTLEYLFRSLPTLSDVPAVKPLPSGKTVFLEQNAREQEMATRQTLIQGSSSFLLDKQEHMKTYQDMQNELKRESIATVDLKSDVTLGVWVSFAEIYNEHIYDLLQAPPMRGRSRLNLTLGKIKDTSFIKNLREVSVCSGLEAYQLLQYGLQNLNYAATAINSHSSRSHCIFTIKLVQDGEKGSHISHFNFCDLAGAERLKKTCNVGERLRESNNINRSLLVLGKCISIIRDLQKGNNDNRLIPFRESKLTQLFQRALNGFENVLMIVSMNACKEMFEETQHVLNFSAVAKDIIVEDQTRQLLKPTRKGRFSDYLTSKTITSGLTNDQENYKTKYFDLKLLLEQREEEMEELFTKERNRIIEGYKRIIVRKEEIRDSYWEQKMKKLTRYYQQQLARQQAEVVDLTTSDDENAEQQKLLYETEIMSLKNTLAELQLQLDKSRDNQKKEDAFLQQENVALKETLEDAEKEFLRLEADHQSLQTKHDILLGEKLALIERVNLLESQLFNNNQEESDEYIVSSNQEKIDFEEGKSC